MENLDGKWSQIILSERENTGFVLQRDQQSGEFILAAQLLMPQFLDMEVEARTSKLLWRSMNGSRIRNHKENRVLFAMDNLGDVGKCYYERSKPRTCVEFHGVQQ